MGYKDGGEKRIAKKIILNYIADERFPDLFLVRR